MDEKRKPFLLWHIGPFWLNLGWFRGEEFKLFNITVLELGSYQDKIDFVAVLDFQIAKFCLAFGLYP